MQEFLDNQEMQIKKLANFDVSAERDFRSMTVYDFLFHLWTLDKHIGEQERNNK